MKVFLNFKAKLISELKILNKELNVINCINSNKILNTF